MGELSRSIEVEATLTQLETVMSFLEEALEEAGCPMKTSMKIAVSIEELYVNVVNYAYTPLTGVCIMMIQAEYEGEQGSVRIELRDKGKAFNPWLRENPDISLSAEEREIGGLGIYMVKQSMDRVDYHYENGENRVSVEKDW